MFAENTLAIIQGRVFVYTYIIIHTPEGHSMNDNQLSVALSSAGLTAVQSIARSLADVAEPKANGDSSPLLTVETVDNHVYF